MVSLSPLQDAEGSDELPTDQCGKAQAQPRAFQRGLRPGLHKSADRISWLTVIGMASQLKNERNLNVTSTPKHTADVIRIPVIDHIVVGVDKAAGIQE